MSNNTTNHIVYDGSMTPEMFAEKLAEMRAAVCFDGEAVINPKVTDKVTACQTRDASDIQRAGVSGMTAKNGILKNFADLFFSNNYGGKVLDIAGLSGFAGNNRRCIERARAGFGICSACFSFIGSKFSNLNAWTKNDTILSTVQLKPGSVIIDPDLVPEMRYSTHGDLINALHAYNLIQIAYDNPRTQFTLWTKNHFEYSTGRARFIADHNGAFPKNLRVIFSATLTDQYFTEYQLKALKAAGYDAVFAVYETWHSQDIAVNSGAFRCVCGRGSCKHHCHFCYDFFENTSAFPADRAAWIAEIKDGERHKE